MRRWQAYTRRDAILKATGETFEEVAAARAKTGGVPSSKRPAGAHRAAGPQASPCASYAVGYRRPPKQHQFRSGQSGNRKGRPKGAKNTATLLREILDRRIEVQNGDTLRKITVREGHADPLCRQGSWKNSVNRSGFAGGSKLLRRWSHEQVDKQQVFA